MPLGNFQMGNESRTTTTTPNYCTKLIIRMHTSSEHGDFTENLSQWINYAPFSHNNTNVYATEEVKKTFVLPVL